MTRNLMALLAIVFTVLVAATFVAPQVVTVPAWLTLLHAASALVTGYAAFGDRVPSRL
jgi:ABC-type multidrug transport system permease subunit